MRRVVSLPPLLVLSGLIGNTVATSPTYSNGTERNENGTDLDTDASMSKSASLESFCSAQLNSFVATYQSTEIATSRWTWYEGFGPTDSLGDLTGSVTSQSYWTSTFLCKYRKDQNASSVFFWRASSRYVASLFSSSFSYPFPALAFVLLAMFCHAITLYQTCPSFITYFEHETFRIVLILIRYTICHSRVHTKTAMLQCLLYDSRHNRLLLLARPSNANDTSSRPT
jgi:hypothetical protein